MDVTLFSLLTLAFITIFFGLRKISFSLFGATMLIYVYWFAFHATDKLNINL